MICPDCGARMADGTSTCPRCGRDMGVTNSMPRVRGTWCSSCGALIPEDASSCPKCGLPLKPERPVRRTRDIRLPKVSASDSTSQFSAIDVPEPDPSDRVFEAKSALPPEPADNDDHVFGYDRMAHVRVMIIAAIAALFVMGGSIVLITHPFDPGRYDQRAREDADTSTAGSPGQIESLTGQDVRDAAPDLDPSSSTFERLHELYVDLAALAERTDEQEAYFLENYLQEDFDVRNAGLAACEELQTDIAAAVDALERLGSSPAYAEDAGNAAQLGRWLLYRADILVDSWELDLGFLAPALVQDIIDATYYSDKDEDGVSMNKRYFDVCYEDWEPQQR